MAVSVRKRLFTVTDYYRMAEDDRVELIEGEVLSMAPIGNRHAGTVGFLAESFLRHLGGRAQVRVQSPIRLGEYSEPQIAVLPYCRIAVLPIRIADHPASPDYRTPDGVS